jgi:hypothetical protein
MQLKLGLNSRKGDPRISVMMRVHTFELGARSARKPKTKTPDAYPLFCFHVTEEVEVACARLQRYDCW